MTTPLVPDDAFGLVRSFTRHIGFVRLALYKVTSELERRGLVHDLSKMLDDEFAGFSRINAAARINKFGSPEYAAGLKQERPTIDLHFSRNSHHPERPDLIANKEADDLQFELKRTELQMTFLDIIEMVCDWWGAGKGYDSTMSWEGSVELNLMQKGQHLSPEQIWLAREVAKFLGRLE